MGANAPVPLSLLLPARCIAKYAVDGETSRYRSSFNPDPRLGFVHDPIGPALDAGLLPTMRNAEQLHRSGTYTNVSAVLVVTTLLMSMIYYMGDLCGWSPL